MLGLKRDRGETEVKDVREQLRRGSPELGTGLTRHANSIGIAATVRAERKTAPDQQTVVLETGLTYSRIKPTHISVPSKHSRHR
jgi:hypothetical protein